MKKNVLSILLCVALVCTLMVSAFGVSAISDAYDVWDGTSVSASIEGAGTEADPYLIKSAADLLYVSAQANAEESTCFEGEYIKLMTGIDLADFDFPMLTVFKGNFDGNGYEIKGLYINKPDSENVAFFGQLKGTVKNLTLTGDVTGKKYVGGFAAVTVNGSASIINCVNNVNITAEEVAAGFVSSVKNSTFTIDKCVNNGNINATTTTSYAFIGGFIGFAGNESTVVVVSNSQNNGTLTATRHYAGGIVGAVSEKATLDITYCINAGSITAGTSVGGILGINQSGNAIVTMNKCINYGKVASNRPTSSSTAIGAIVGAYGNGFVANTNATATYYCSEDVDFGVAPDYQVGYESNIVGTAKEKADFTNGTILALLNEGESEVKFAEGEAKYPVLAWTVAAPEVPECEHETTKDAIIEEATYFKAGLKNVVCADDACGAMVETDVVIPAVDVALKGDFTETFADGKLTIAWEYSDDLALDILDGAKISFNYSINGYTNVVELDGQIGASITLEGFNADRLNADLTYYLSALYGDVDTTKLNAVGGAVKTAEIANDEKLDALLDALEADAVVNGTVANTEWLVSNTAKLDLKAATAELRITASQKLIDTLAKLGKEGRTVTLTVKVGDITKTFTLEKLYKVTIIKVSGLSFEQLNGNMSAQLNIDYEGADNDILTDEIVFACGDMIANADTAAADAFAAYMSK